MEYGKGGLPGRVAREAASLSSIGPRLSIDRMPLLAYDHTDGPTGEFILAAATWEDIPGLELTLPGAGTYQLYSAIRYNCVDALALFQLYDATNAVAIGNVVIVWLTTFGYQNQGVAYLRSRLVVTGPTIIRARSYKDTFYGNPAGVMKIYDNSYGNTYMDYQQLLPSA